MSRGFFDYKDRVLNDIEDSLNDHLRDKNIQKEETTQVLNILELTKNKCNELSDLLYEVDSYLSGDYGEMDLIEYALDHNLLPDLTGSLNERLVELRKTQKDFLINPDYGTNKEKIEMHRQRGDKIEPCIDLKGWYKITYKEALEGEE